METSKRNPFLDIIKAFCILFVIINHDIISAGFRLKALFPFWVEMAVPMFMIISGYVYAASFERHGIEHISDAYTKEYLLPRFIRYTVPFVLAYLVEIVAEFLTAYLGEITTTVSIKYLFITFFQGGFGPGSYYYPVLLQLLLFYPVIYFIIKKHGFKGLLFCFFLNAGFEFFQMAWGCNEEFYRMLLFRYTSVIAFGSYLWQCKDEKVHWPLTIAGFVAGVACIVSYRYFMYEPKIIIYWTDTSFVATMYLLPIAAYLIKRVHWSFKPLETIGKASYNIFLVQMVYYAYCLGIVRSHISSHWIQLSLHIVVCIGVGLIFYAIEQPLTKKIIAVALPDKEK